MSGIDDDLIPWFVFVCGNYRCYDLALVQCASL